MGVERNGEEERNSGMHGKGVPEVVGGRIVRGRGLDLEFEGRDGYWRACDWSKLAQVLGFILKATRTCDASRLGRVDAFLRSPRNYSSLRFCRS